MARASVRMSWESRQVEQMTQRAIRAGLGAAGKHGRGAVKAKLAAGGDNVPGVQSGILRRAVAYRVRSKRGRWIATDVGVLLPSTWDAKAKGKTFRGRMHAQALRLARGYTGTDRKGRRYNQRPRPFIEPVLNAERDNLARIVSTTAATWMPKPKEKR